jgi:hypothetical protein
VDAGAEPGAGDASGWTMAKTADLVQGSRPDVADRRPQPAEQLVSGVRDAARGSAF